MTSLVLTDIEARDPAIAGVKAAALAALLSAGFKVPRFCVAPPAAFEDGAMVGPAREALAAALPALGPGPYALRASAYAQDGGAATQSRRRVSLLNVGREDVLPVVERLHAAASDSAPQGAPAIIVQAMIQPQARGVAYSRDPVTGARDLVLICALADENGAGEDQTYAYDTAADAEIAAPDGERLLRPADVWALASMARAVEAARGGAQDIDWAIAAGETFLLSARLIRPGARRDAAPAEAFAVFDNSNIAETFPGLVSPLTFSLAQYAQARAAEILARMLGLGRRRAAAAAPALEQLLENIDGRIYSNLAAWRRLLAMLPGYRINGRRLDRLIGLGEPLDPALAEALGPQAKRGVFNGVVDYGRMLRACGSIAWTAVMLRRKIIHFRRRVDTVLALDGKTIGALPPGELAKEFRRVKAEVIDRWDAPVANDFFLLTANLLYRRRFGLWYGKAGIRLYDEGLIGQANIVSIEPARRIRAMAAVTRGDDALLGALQRGDLQEIRRHASLNDLISQYLSKFGDRCPDELKLESLPLTQDPQPLFSAIVAAAQSGRDPATSVSAPMQQLAALNKARPLRRRLSQYMLRYARSRLRDRETLRFERALITAHARRLLMAMGAGFYRRGWIGEPRDVLYLTMEETLAAAEFKKGNMQLREVIARRARDFGELRSLPEPPERIVRGAAGNLRGLYRGAAPPAGVSDDSLRKGAGCCPGVVRGRACVIRDANSEPVAVGDIIVARHLDPGWISLMTNASGIIVERGDMQSHAAIVAHEFGIPCVAGLKGATAWLANGDMIEMDGAAGAVRRLEAWRPGLFRRGEE